MDQVSGYQFDDLDEKVMMDALSMYANYMQWTTTMLVGDESDANKIYRENVRTQELAEHFIEMDIGEPIEEYAEHAYGLDPETVYAGDFSKEDFFERFQ